MDDLIVNPTSATVRGGEINGDYLIIVTEKEEIKAPWSHVEYIFLGKIVESLSITVANNERKPGMMSKSPGSGRQAGFTTKKMDQSEYYLAFVFIRNYDYCFRFDTIGTNFRQLLGPEAGYSGMINYNLAIQKIIASAHSSLLDPSAEQFKTNGKSFIVTYGSREEALNRARMQYKKLERTEKIVRDDSAPTVVKEEAMDDGDEMYSIDLI